jgi:hypothetical protein
MRTKWALAVSTARLRRRCYGEDTADASKMRWQTVLEGDFCEFEHKSDFS